MASVSASQPVPVNQTTAGYQTLMDVFVTPAGGFEAMWSSVLAGPGPVTTSYVFRQFDAAGHPLTAETSPVDPASLPAPPRQSDAVLADGTILKVVGHPFGALTAQVFNPDGTTAGDPLVLGPGFRGWSYWTTALPDGDVAVVWQGVDGVGPAEIFATMLHPVSAPAPAPAPPPPPPAPAPADSVPPAPLDFSPAAGSTAQPPDWNIAITFDEAIRAGTGGVVLQTEAGAVVQTFAGADPGLHFLGASLVIDPSADLQPGTTYRLIVGSDAVEDLAGNPYAGESSYTFTTAGLPQSGPVGATFSGGPGNDTLQGTAGNDSFDGGAGVDTVVFSGARANYGIARSGAGWTVTDTTGRDGSDTLSGIERLQFADAKVALDIDGHAGQACRLYQAAFDRAPDLPGLGYWIRALDGGLSLVQVAQSFTDSSEFVGAHGSADTNQFIALLYANVLHRTPDAGGQAYWLDHLVRGDVTRAEALAFFSESAENQAALVGAVSQGIAFS